MASIPSTTGWKATGKTYGEGGQAHVLEVQRVGAAGDPIETFAMKVLKRVNSKQALARFQRETAAISQIDDPRVVTIIDKHGEAPSFLYYVMPNYARDGFESLQRLAFSEESPFKNNVAAALDFVASCAEALAACHTKGIVHRDIQPQNILVHRISLEPRILDFGCCDIENGAPITLVDEGVGTQNYMAPECEAGAEGRIGPRSDVYSLGKLLWVLVTGQQPFARERPGFTHRNVKLLRPNESDVWHINPILLLTVRQDIDRRYSDATTLAQECRRTAGEIIGRYPPIEQLRDRCQVCGRGRLVRSTNANDLQLHAVFGNPMPDGLSAYACGFCGHLSAWDDRKLDRWRRELDEAE